jgi:hypothetical protein
LNSVEDPEFSRATKPNSSWSQTQLTRPIVALVEAPARSGGRRGSTWAFVSNSGIALPGSAIAPERALCGAQASGSKAFASSQRRSTSSPAGSARANAAACPAQGCIRWIRASCQLYCAPPPLVLSAPGKVPAVARREQRRRALNRLLWRGRGVRRTPASASSPPAPVRRGRRPRPGWSRPHGSAKRRCRSAPALAPKIKAAAIPRASPALKYGL